MLLGIGTSRRRNGSIALLPATVGISIHAVPRAPGSSPRVPQHGSLLRSTTSHRPVCHTSIFRRPHIRLHAALGVPSSSCLPPRRRVRGAQCPLNKVLPVGNFGETVSSLLRALGHYSLHRQDVDRNDQLAMYCQIRLKRPQLYSHINDGGKPSSDLFQRIRYGDPTSLLPVTNMRYVPNSTERCSCTYIY